VGVGIVTGVYIPTSSGEECVCPEWEYLRLREGGEGGGGLSTPVHVYGSPVMNSAIWTCFGYLEN